jgi:aspartate 1-decarboxylase
MLRKMMRAKIHRVRVTQCDPDYVGSITIDADLLRAVDIRPMESVLVLDIDNAARFETYVIRGEPGSGIIGVNGAAAHLVAPDHRLIIVAFGLLQPNEVDAHEARVVVGDEHNRIVQSLVYDTRLDEPVPPLVDPAEV